MKISVIKLVGKLSILTLIMSLLSSCSNAVDSFFVGLVDRPQEPKERSYIVKNVSFTGGNSGVKIAGELTYPKGKGPFPALVLITGYGSQYEPFDRDYYLGKLVGHKTYLVLSDLMTKRGYAVLRYDNRGIRESTGDWTEATDPVYASDAAAALRWLRNKSGVPISKAGYIGHSQGGIKAPLAAQIEYPDFMVLLAGGVESTAEIIVNIALDKAKELKLSQSDKDTMTKQYEDIFTIMRNSKDRHVAKEHIKEYLINQGASFKEAEIASTDLSKPVDFESLDRNWGIVIKKYKGPVLALYGGKDKLVVADRNIERTKAVLVNTYSKVKLFPNMNHMFQPAKKGGVDEYWEIETTFDESVVDYMDMWLKKINQTAYP